jgi:hypothetical protein
MQYVVTHRPTSTQRPQHKRRHISFVPAHGSLLFNARTASSCGDSTAVGTDDVSCVDVATLLPRSSQSANELAG